ncbi:MAG: methylated-DNA--[protein]-cysteine S-methyltransferase [Tuberibacillus sp.]
MKSYIFIEEMDSPIGPLTVACFEDSLCHIAFGTYEETNEELRAWTDKHRLAVEFRQNQEYTRDAVKQLNEYFQLKRKYFDLPLTLFGTPFQVKVWEALRTIEYGETKTYKDIAEMIGQPKAVRAVGGANNKNPLSIIVPCHRVIGANGSLVGYGGGLDKKEILLGLERQ